MREIELINLGVESHSKVDKMMRELQQMRIIDDIQDTLIFVEHAEVVTVGPKARNDGIHPPSDFSSIDVDRGGGLTWHGPGQIVIYPIFKWDLDGEVNTKKIIHILEEWIIRTLVNLGINGYRDERMMGVWVSERKICCIGLSFLRWVSRHGLSINYNTPSGRVEMLEGCGLGAGVTSSLAELGHTIEREQIESALLDNLHCLKRTL